MSADQIMPNDAKPFTVRRFQTQDHAGVMALYAQYAGHECPPEMAELASAPREGAAADHRIWVAEAAGQIIGSAAVFSLDVRIAHFKYLSVATDQFDRHRVARAIAELAVADVWERGYLKLIVHTQTPANRVAADLREMGFEFSREHDVAGEHVLEFYQNLYEMPGLLTRQGGEIVDANVVTHRFTKRPDF
jgi:N-acetylglutamate synthase-like GNAT family acetyltransferase